MIVHGIILFLLSLSLAQAAETAPPQAEQALRQLLDDIDKHEQRNDRQRAALQRIEQQLACNWTLIRSYEICDRLYQDEPQNQLTCVRKAKENAARCLTGTSD
ncbi:MAG TPA: hypothetical protein ENI97_14625 [Gammaproteobacteria bacterium]|nr:hypothetical protein [Gammaproteobacteria bacterium]